MVTTKKAMVLLLAGLITPGGPLSLRAAPNSRPVITEIDLCVKKGQLSCDVKTEGLFSERIVGTVRSGLPAVVELFFHLTETNKKTVKRGVFSCSLNYDVWDDIYSLSAEDSTRRFSTFEALRGAVEHLRSIALVPVEEILSDRSYIILLSVAVNPLQGTERRKIDGWIRDKVSRQEEDSWHEQVMSLNELISHFFTRDTDVTNRSEWFQSGPFELDLLPKKEEER
ncbi:MAG: DUF4390 domain-containing protein [Candidatus Krumholzibacteriota bacterium]|nr:DUF4390 domain-containing protein [Candidatus Krumholzibacteriota bacterium]